MKKLLRIISATLLSVGIMAGTAAAVATGPTGSCANGSISGTGPGSNNVIVCKTDSDTNVSCENNIIVSDENHQNAHSGDSFTFDNTSAGVSHSGDSSNVFDFNLNADIACAPVQTTSVTPPAGGKGGGAPAPAVTPAGGKGAAAPVALPETGSNSVADDLMVGAAVVGSSLVVSQLGMLAYRRLALK